MKRTEKVIEYAKAALGCRYSQDERMKEGVYDCSSLVYRAYKAAGYKMSTTTSTYEVEDKGFDLLYPASRAVLGKRFTSVAEQRKAGYKPLYTM